MVRNYVRKTTQASWSEASMKEAIRVVKNKEMGLRKAARTYDVPKDSLTRRVNKLKHVGPNDAVLDIHKNLGRSRNVLSESQELELKQYIINMDKAFYGLTIMDIRVLVFEYFERNKITNPFNKETKLAGEDFVRGFLKRHKDLSLRKPQGVALNRVYGLNKEAVTTYFNNLEKLFNEHKFEPHQIYNCDETVI